MRSFNKLSDNDKLKYVRTFVEDPNKAVLTLLKKHDKDGYFGKRIENTNCVSPKKIHVTQSKVFVHKEVKSTSTIKNKMGLNSKEYVSSVSLKTTETDLIGFIAKRLNQNLNSTAYSHFEKMFMGWLESNFTPEEAKAGLYWFSMTAATTVQRKSMLDKPVMVNIAKTELAQLWTHIDVIHCILRNKKLKLAFNADAICNKIISKYSK